MPALSKGFSQGLALSIPLAVKKFEIEAAQKKWETEMDMKQDQLNLANDELEAEKREAKTKLLIESAQKFQEAGDQRGLESIHEQLRGLGHSGVPEVPAMSPGVLDIAQQLRGEGGVPLEEGIPRKFYTPPTKLEKFKSEKEFEYGLKVELEKSKQKGPYKEGQIKDFKVGDKFIQMKYTKGEWVSTGIKAPRYKPGVTINLPDTVTPTMKTKLQTEMFERQQAIDRLNQIEKLTKDEYLTYFGKGKAKISEMMSKAGIATKDIEKATADYGEWESATKVHTLLWRKLITGVAGGEKEMKAIEETTINVKDSAPRFRRKLQRQKIMAKAAKQRAQFSSEHFGGTFKDLTPKQKLDVQKRFPFVAASENQDADELLKELGYE